MIRRHTHWTLGVMATSALLFALGVGVNVGFAHDDDDTRERPIGDFVNAQGTLCLGVPPDCFLFVPPVANFVGWTDPVLELFASVDYAGLADDLLGGSLGTEFDGEVTERPLPDGRAEVTVELETENALTFIVDGFDVAGGPLLLGERVAADGTIDDPVLGESFLRLVFIHTAPGADLPDLLQLLFLPEPGQEVISIEFEAEAESEEGEVEVEQICPAPCGENGFAFSVETIELEFDDDND